MTTVARFAPALGDWVRQNLNAGQAAGDLIQALQSYSVEPAAARAIVEAFVQARRDGSPPPLDSVEYAERAEAVPCDGSASLSRLPSGNFVDVGDRRVRVLARAAQPSLAVLSDVLDADECAELIEQARPRLAPSTLVDPVSGLDVVSRERTSRGMFFRPRENAFIAGLERRIAQLMGLPVEHGEGLQVLHYPAGAGSSPHFDFLAPSNAANMASIARSGQRISTLVTYLNDVQAGGETVFPAAGLSVAAQRGHAVYFESCGVCGTPDESSLHAGNVVVTGEKWVATTWMRARPFVSANAARQRPVQTVTR